MIVLNGIILIMEVMKKVIILLMLQGMGGAVAEKELLIDRKMLLVEMDLMVMLVSTQHFYNCLVFVRQWFSSNVSSKQSLN